MAHIERRHVGAHHANPLNRGVLITSLLALVVAAIWIGAYGWGPVSLQGSRAKEASCHLVKDDATRLACYDHASQLQARPSGRGYAPE